MRRLVLLVVCFLLLSLPSRANLRETVEQCVARYGKPTGYSEADAKNPFGTLLFKANGYLLTLFILNNVEVGARVAKIDKSNLTQAEIETILAADSGGLKWTSEPSDNPSDAKWSRSDNAIAVYNSSIHVLSFTTFEMGEAIQAQKAKTAN